MIDRERIRKIEAHKSMVDGSKEDSKDTNLNQFYVKTRSTLGVNLKERHSIEPLVQFGYFEKIFLKLEQFLAKIETM